MSCGVRSALPDPRVEVRSSPVSCVFPTDGQGAESKETLCRNILIYGNCRYEDQGCTFNHDQNKSSSAQSD
jgi:hypothetical protein